MRCTVQSLALPVVDVDLAVGERDRDVARADPVVEEVPLDELALVAQGDHELVEAVRVVDLHDVPEDRRSADLDHRLRARVGLLRDARAHAAGEDDGLHERLPASATLLSTESVSRAVFSQR